MNSNNRENIDKFNKVFEKKINDLQDRNAHTKIRVEFNVKDGNLQRKVKILPEETILL